MEKIIWLLWKKPEHTAEQLRDRLCECAPLLQNRGAARLRINVADDAVAPASKLRITRLQPAPDAMLSLWLDTALYRPAINELLAAHISQSAAYVVTESEPLVNRLHPAPQGERTLGMNQVVLLNRPASLNNAEWLDLWLNHHTPIALTTQATFGYRQNIVSRKLDGHAPDIDAIVEENFPAAAMTDRTAFYNCTGDKEEMKRRSQAMFASVQRFIDFEQIDCLPMSQYEW